MLPKDRVKLLIARLREEMAARGVSLKPRKGHLIVDDDISLAYLRLTGTRHATADLTLRYVEIAVRSLYLDRFLFEASWDDQYCSTSCPFFRRIDCPYPDCMQAWPLTDEASCLQAAREIADLAAPLWKAEIEPKRTHEGMLAHISLCSVYESRFLWNRPHHIRRWNPSTLHLCGIGYLLHTLNEQPTLETYIRVVSDHLAQLPVSEIAARLQIRACLDYITTHAPHPSHSPIPDP
jgi:hypothetical protein